MSSKAVLIVAAGAAGLGAWLYRTQIETALGISSGLITPPAAAPPPPDPTTAAQTAASNVIAAGGTPAQAATAAQQASTTTVAAALVAQLTEAQLAQASVDPAAAAALNNQILLNVSQWNYYRKIASPTDKIFLAPTSVGDNLITAMQYQALRASEPGSLGGTRAGQWKHQTAFTGPRAAWR
jgi:hypothetical protein